MSPREFLAVSLVLGALSLLGCGDDLVASGGSGGAAGAGGNAGTGGNGGSGDTGGIGGAFDADLCALGRCATNEALKAACQEEYDACVGRGHYDWACRIDADESCGL